MLYLDITSFLRSCETPSIGFTKLVGEGIVPSCVRNTAGFVSHKCTFQTDPHAGWEVEGPPRHLGPAVHPHPSPRRAHPSALQVRRRGASLITVTEEGCCCRVSIPWPFRLSGTRRQSSDPWLWKQYQILLVSLRWWGSPEG